MSPGLRRSGVVACVFFFAGAGFVVGCVDGGGDVGVLLMSTFYLFFVLLVVDGGVGWVRGRVGAGPICIPSILHTRRCT